MTGIKVSFLRDICTIQFPRDVAGPRRQAGSVGLRDLYPADETPHVGIFWVVQTTWEEEARGCNSPSGLN